MTRVSAIGVSVVLGAALVPQGAVPAEAEVKSKAKGAPGVARDASTSSTKQSRGQQKQMLGWKKAHPDFLWSPN